MAITFPIQLDTFINPGPTDRMSDVPHSQQHANVNDAIVALEAKVGIDGSDATEGSIEQRLRILEEAPSRVVHNEQLIFGIDGGGGTITIGLKKALRVPFDCTITGWSMLSDDKDNTSGSIVVDILKTTFASYPAATSITASAKPTLSSGIRSTSATLTDWSVSLSGGDILRFNVDSSVNLKSVSLYVHVERSV